MKKLSKGFTLIRSFKKDLESAKAFTLIELLIVIAIIGVLAGAVWIALNPLDKINAANDSKVQSDIGSLGQAVEAYATTHSGLYPVAATAQADLEANGDLKQALTPPNNNYGANYTFFGDANCTTSGTDADCTFMTICAPLLANRWNATADEGVFVYHTETGRGCAKNVTGRCGATEAEIAAEACIQ